MIQFNIMIQMQGDAETDTHPLKFIKTGVLDAFNVDVQVYDRNPYASIQASPRCAVGNGLLPYLDRPPTRA